MIADLRFLCYLTGAGFIATGIMGLGLLVQSLRLHARVSKLERNGR